MHRHVSDTQLHMTDAACDHKPVLLMLNLASPSGIVNSIWRILVNFTLYFNIYYMIWDMDMPHG